MYADLSTATAATINAIRTAFQVQKLLERDARGGTRYTEIIRSHFGVVSPDSRLQRPEYLGGSSVPVNIAPVAQTSASAISGSATPQGNLSAIVFSLPNSLSTIISKPPLLFVLVIVSPLLCSLYYEPVSSPNL